MNLGKTILNQNINKMQNYYMDTDSFIINNKTEDFCKDICNGAEKRFDNNYN